MPSSYFELLIVGSLKCDKRLLLRNKMALLYHVALCLISIQAACRTRTVASELDTLQSFKYLVFKPSGICVAAYFPRAPITRLIKSSKLFWKIILRPVLPQFITYMKFIWKKYFFELLFMFRVTDSLTVDTLGNMRLVVGDFTTTSRNRKTLKIYRKLNKGVKIRFFVSCLFVFEPEWD